MINKDLFKSRIFIAILSMAINVIFICIGTLWFKSNLIHIEVCALLSLSLLLGPYSIAGFAIVEVLYAFFVLDITSIPILLLNVFTLIAIGMTPWKLWYSMMNRNGFETVNMNSLYSFAKLIIIILLVVLQTAALFNCSISLTFESFLITFIFGLILLLISIGLFGRFNIPAYTPKRQYRKILPDKLYNVALAVSIIVSIYTFTDLNVLLLIPIMASTAIFLIKPFDEEVFNLKGTQKPSIFYYVCISIFFILMILPLIIIITMQISGIYKFTVSSEVFDYLVILSRFFFAFLIPLAIYMLFLERQVIKPANQVSKYLSGEIRNKDDLKNLVENINSINVNNEIKSLAQSLFSMQEEYVDYSTNLLSVTKEKERLETELKLAHQIQNSMIATDFEKFNENERFSLWAAMKSSREVGGDFYDYFRVDDENIVFAIGDISDKGVSAALIMVKAMTLIQDYAKYHEDISQTLYELNNDLKRDNVDDLSLTCWLGKLNVKTGQLTYVNAGHNRPLIMQNGGEFEFLNCKMQPALGETQDYKYEKHTITLDANDALFLYTDGITNTKDIQNRAYGKENLKRILDENRNSEAKSIIESVEADIAKFSKGSEQKDDTTMLAIKWSEVKL